MRPSGVLLFACVCLVAFALFDADPAYAAVESAGLFDRATQHFKNSLTKWGDTMTNAAEALFWMLATIAFCWELGNLALRGGSMEAALAFILRFVLIEGIWLYVLKNAVPIGTAIIDSLRQLGSTASGLPRDLMPSAILDIGFGVLWKAIDFASENTLSAPIVSFCALLMALFILVALAVTAINMLVLIVSQWFLLYGGIFFLGFGGASWASDKARNYLNLALSIGAQLLGMAGVVGLGQSFIQEQYAQMSGDTTLGELAVILVVALLIGLLSNEIPKLFTRFAPGYAPAGIGVATLLGATASAAAVLGATAAMAKGAMESVAGTMKAMNAAYSAAKAQSSLPLSSPRSQTGVSSSRIGSNGASAPTGASHASTRTQGPLGAVLGGNGIGIGNSRSGAGDRSASSSRSSTQATPEQRGTAASKSSSSQPTPAAADEKPAAARTDAQATPSANADSNASSQTPRSSTQTEEQAHNGHGARDREQDSDETSAAHSSTGDTQTAEEARTDKGADDEHDEVEASKAHNETGSANESSGAEERAESERAQNAGTGSDRSRSPSEDEGAKASSDRVATAARSEPASTIDASSVDPAGGSAPSAGAAAPTPTSNGSGTAAAAGPTAAATGAADTAHAPPASQTQPTGASHASAPSTPTSSSSTSGAADSGATQKKAATASSTPTSFSSTSGAAAAPPKASSDVEGSPSPPASSSAVPESGPAAAEPTDTTGTSGGARGSTSIGTFATAAKILGQQTVQHHKGRVKHAWESFSARADQTAGGRIAQAIRKEYELDPPPKEETESRPLRSHTGAGKPGVSETHASGPKHPADWVTGDDPMTENQHFFLSQRLGADLDPNMTKAEASTLIEEILDDER